MAKTYYVYIMASKHNGTLYIGVTSDLVRRVGEHRDGLVPGFSPRPTASKDWFITKYSTKWATQFIAKRNSKSINGSGRST